MRRPEKCQRRVLAKGTLKCSARFHNTKGTVSEPVPEPAAITQKLISDLSVTIASWDCIEKCMRGARIPLRRAAVEVLADLMVSVLPVRPRTAASSDPNWLVRDHLLLHSAVHSAHSAVA